MYFLLQKKTRELKAVCKTKHKADKEKYRLLDKEGIRVLVKKGGVKKRKKDTLEIECENLWRKIGLHVANNKCEYCGKTSNLNCHHIFTRSRNSTKWDTDNCLVLCIEHHTLSKKISAHKSPKAFFEWLESYKGKDFIELLQCRSKQYCKPDLKLTIIYLKQEVSKRGIL